MYLSRLSLIGLLLTALGVSSAAVAQPNDDRQVALEGHVVGPSGEAIAGARICLSLSDEWYKITRGYGKRQDTPEVLGVSKADGTFRVLVSLSDLDQSLLADPQSTYSKLIAIPPPGASLGVDWNAAAYFNVSDEARREMAARDPEFANEWETSRVLRLSRDEVPLRGRLQSADGKPAAGARVRVLDIQQMRNEDLNSYVKIAMRESPRDYDEARTQHVGKRLFGEHGRPSGLGDLLTAMTDERGEFALRGFGQNRAGWLIIEGDGIATELLLVRSEPGKKLGMKDGEATFEFFPAEFAHTLRASVRVEGTVVDQDTGQPIAGVVVGGYGRDSNKTRSFPIRFVWTTTDQSGRYRLTGFPAGQGESVVLLASAHDSPHLPSISEPVDMSAAMAAIRLDWKLKRGVWIEGRVFDEKTSRPILAHLHYFAFQDNPHAAQLTGFRGSLSYPMEPPYRSNRDGHYRVPGLPGRGIVAVRVDIDPEAGRYPNSKGKEEIAGAQGSGLFKSYATLPSDCQVGFYHGLREVRPQEGADRVKLDFSLVPSQTLTGHVLDASGRKLSEYAYAGRTDVSFYMLDNKGEEFRVEQYEPDVPRRIIFWHKEQKLAGTFLLQGEQRSPIEVRLEPQGALTGRVIDNDGAPLAGLTLEVAPLFPPNPSTSVSPIPGHSAKTGQDGRFRIEGVAPGMKYNVITSDAGDMRQVIFDAVAESGKTKDLGDLQLRPVKVN